MRNLKRALSLTLASVMLLGMMIVGTSAASYPDVDDNDNVEAIEVLSAVGVIVGDNGNFKPDDPVTRNEMAVIMTKLLGLNANDFAGTCPFTDVQTWAQNYVAACYANGIIAGRSATVFDGQATVTATEAAAMMMRALGYFKYPGDYEGGFVAATVRQAASIRLFDGVAGNANAPMTRNDVAQLALNTLEADVVEFTGTMGWEFNGLSVGYESKYSPRQDLNNHNQGYNYTRDTTTTHQKEYLQLLEDLYDGKLIKDTKDSDDFDRPATTWKYNGKVIGSYMNTPDLVYTTDVKLSDIYKDLGLNQAIAASKVDFYRNGKEETETVDGKIADNNTTTPTTLDQLGLSRSTDNKIGANGVLTQVWYNSSTEVVTISMIDTYVGKVATVNKATDAANRSVVVNQFTGHSVPNLSTYLNTKFETENFEAKEVVLYTAAWNDSNKYDIKTMEALGAPVTGKLTKWNGNAIVTGTTGNSKNNFDVDGQTYKYDRDVVVVDDNASQIEGVWKFTVNESEVNVYLDKYGYAIYVSGVKGEANYAAVIGTGSTNPYGDQTVGVTLLLPDGTTKTVTAKVKNLAPSGTAATALTTKPDSNSGQTAQLVNDLIGDLVSYRVKDDGTYELSVLGYPGSGTSYTGKYSTSNITHASQTTFTNGKSEMKLGNNTYYVTSETIFFVATGSGTDISYNVYKGYSAMPSFGTASTDQITGYAYQVRNEYTTQLEVVYIAAGSLGGISTVDTYFVKKANANIIHDSTGDYYVLPAVVDGVVVNDLKIDANITKLSLNNNATQGVFAIKSVVKDKNGIITDFTPATPFNAANNDTGTIVTDNGLIGFGNNGVADASTKYWVYNDKTKVYQVSEKYDAIIPIDPSDIGTDTNDKVYAKGDNSTTANIKALEDVFIVDIQGNGGTSAPSGQSGVNSNIKVTMDGPNKKVVFFISGTANEAEKAEAFQLKLASQGVNATVTPLGGGLYNVNVNGAITEYAEDADASGTVGGVPTQKGQWDMIQDVPAGTTKDNYETLATSTTVSHNAVITPAAKDTATVSNIVWNDIPAAGVDVPNFGKIMQSSSSGHTCTRYAVVPIVNGDNLMYKIIFKDADDKVYDIGGTEIKDGAACNITDFGKFVFEP